MHPLITRNSDFVLVFGVIGIILVMVIPLPAAVLDLLFAVNITVSLVTLLVVLYMLQPVDFSIFPSLLLVLTMFRLSLNVASTRVILTKGHLSTDAAGKVIQSFAQFVVQGNYVVGFVVFFIILIIQFIVITKGSGRIAEVAARFTLDALPMKQMAIDTDLSAGLITDDEARQRRTEVSNEANFYGAMDGASKFVRGDAIAGLIITAINIVGGLIIGVAQRGLPLADAAQKYTLLTIGDGLVSQFPSLVVSLSTGLLISRSSEKRAFGQALLEQYLLQPRALGIAAGVLALIGIVPGMPTFPFLVLSASAGGMTYLATRFPEGMEELPPAADEAVDAAQELTPIEQAEQELDVEPIQLNVGYSLIQLVDPNEGGDLLNRIKEIRSSLARELGLVLPHIRIRDQMDLAPGAYRIVIREESVAEGELRTNEFLAMEVGPVTEEINGTPTLEPTNNQPAMWITADQRERAQMAGYLVIDPSSVLATHLVETTRRHADRFLTRQDVQKLLDRLKETSPAIVDEVLEATSLGLIQKILKNLLKEGVSVRDLMIILEALADQSTITKDPVMLTEAVRQRVGSTICRPYLSEDNALDYVALSEEVEEVIMSGIQQDEQGEYQFLAIEPNAAYQLVNGIANAVTQVAGLNVQPLILCSRSIIRAYLRQFIDIQFPTPITVLSIEEVPPTIQLNEIGRVELTEAE
ncbi:flagellar biosynthesis protein FlhA [Candidatus Poribacteria bacterium]|jgi:flagellar biosynthesis protein FlhA|nr:flagellar biosynthesis protein FlhA [Candidatus Poribacteria bacterium]